MTSTVDPKPSRSSRSRRTSERSWGAYGDGVVYATVGLGVTATTLAIGGAIPSVFVPIASVVMGVALASSFLSPNRSRVPLAAVFVLYALGALCILQSLPLPMSWVHKLSPAAADVWERSLLPYGEGPPSTASLSLDPRASLVEAVKWIAYGATFYLAGISARRRGPNEVLAVLFGITVLVALLSLGHAVVGARSVYGFYQPRHPINPGHAGPFLNDNNLSGYLNLGTLVGMGLLFSKQPVVPKWTIGVGVLLTATISLRTASRGGIAALAIGIFAFAVGTLLTQQNERASKRLVLMASTGVFVVAAAFAVIGGDQRFWADLLSENMMKLKLPSAAAPLVRDHLVFGVGRGAFESVFHAYRPQSNFNIVFTHPENVLVQWAAEWGVFAASAAILVLAWALWPTKLGVTKSKAALGAFCGAGALVVHNLVDLGMELAGPGMMLAAVLGTLATGYVRSHTRPKLLVQWLGRGAIVTGLLAAVVAMVNRPTTLQDDREEVRTMLEQRRKDDGAQLKTATSDEIRLMIVRHPADYYFPLAGAMAARLDADNPMPWIQRALERGPKVGRTHLLLAEVLANYRFTRQALMELKLATSYEPGLAFYAAQVAVGLTRDPELLLEAVPDAEAGVGVLEQMSRGLASEEDHDMQARVDAEIIARAPRSVGPYEREAERHLVALSRNTCADTPACERRVDEAVVQVEKLSPNTTRGTRLRARLLLLQAKPEEAIATLQEGCSKPEERTSCYRLLASTLVDKRSSDEAIGRAFESLGAAACLEKNQCADVHSWMGEVRTSRGELQLAVAAFERSAREDPSVDRWVRLADAAARAKLIATEVDALEQALRLDRSNTGLEERLRRARTRPQ